MTLLAAERIKLFSTRSPRWCIGLALVATVGVSAVIAMTTDDDPVDVPTTQFGYGFGLVIVMVMAVLAVTTEYRFGTIRLTYQAVPKRVHALIAKAGLIALVAGVVGEVAAFASWAVAEVLRPSSDLTINTAYEWRVVAGTGLVYGLSAVIAVAVGLLIRHSAGSVALILIYTLLVEDLIDDIPHVGPAIFRWLPFTVADHFLSGRPDASFKAPPDLIDYSPWLAGLYFAAFSLAALAAAIVVANRRDA